MRLGVVLLGFSVTRDAVATLGWPVLAPGPGLRGRDPRRRSATRRRARRPSAGRTAGRRRLRHLRNVRHLGDRPADRRQAGGGRLRRRPGHPLRQPVGRPAAPAPGAGGAERRGVRRLGGCRGARHRTGRRGRRARRRAERDDRGGGETAAREPARGAGHSSGQLTPEWSRSRARRPTAWAAALRPGVRRRRHPGCSRPGPGPPGGRRGAGRTLLLAVGMVGLGTAVPTGRPPPVSGCGPSPSASPSWILLAGGTLLGVLAVGRADRPPASPHLDARTTFARTRAPTSAARAGPR